MKKTLKLVGIFICALTLIIVASISIYFLIERNKTYYIYDVRIVMPNQGSRYYIYTDSEASYSLMKNQVVYMTNADSNRFEIAVYAHTSTDTTDIELTSSNNSVASISVRNGHCYVEYKQAGVAEITASLGGVSDKITVTVYDNIAEELIVYDDAYYGEEYKEYYPNRIVSYADSNLYSYNYVVSSFTNGEFSTNINSENLRVEYDTDIFENVYINPNNQTLNVQCKSTYIDEEGNIQMIDETNDAAIYIQSFYTMGSGSNITYNVVKNYVVNVHIVADTPEYLQVVLSTTPDFNDGSVYVYTQNYDGQEIDIENKDIVDEILANQKETTYLYANSEHEYYNAYFTDKVSTIYIRIRKVYTNGNIVYLNPLTEEENPFTLLATNNTNFTISANQNYYVLRLNEEFFAENDSFVISVSLDDYDLSKEFYFSYKSLSQENISYFYSYNEETGIYTYSYWDPRTRYDNEIYDASGNIVGFSYGD